MKSIHEARLVTVNGVIEWRCENCNQKLADVHGNRAVVRVQGRQWSFRIDMDPDQVCPRCGDVSVISSQTAA